MNGRKSEEIISFCCFGQQEFLSILASAADALGIRLNTSKVALSLAMISHLINKLHKQYRLEKNNESQKSTSNKKKSKRWYFCCHGQWQILSTFDRSGLPYFANLWHKSSVPDSASVPWWGQLQNNHTRVLFYATGFKARRKCCTECMEHRSQQKGCFSVSFLSFLIFFYHNSPFSSLPPPITRSPPSPSLSPLPTPQPLHKIWQPFSQKIDTWVWYTQWKTLTQRWRKPAAAYHQLPLSVLPSCELNTFPSSRVQDCHQNTQALSRWRSYTTFFYKRSCNHGENSQLSTKQ